MLITQSCSTLISIQILIASCSALQAPYYCGISIDTLLPFTFAGTPETQFSEYKEECTKGFQSPINIDDPFVPDPLAYVRFSPNAYQAVPLVTAYNPGIAAHIIPLPGAPRINLDFRGFQYVLANTHFHTGQNDYEGSMHTLFGRRYPLEVHLQWFREEYGTIREALKHPAGVIITATLYQIGQRDPQLDSILSVLRRIAPANSTFNYSPNPVVGTIANLMAPVNSGFYSFPGTIESPPCSQGVLWVVFSSVKVVSSLQMSRFRGILRNIYGNVIQKNWRYTQDTRGRPLYLTPPSSGNMIARDVSSNSSDISFNELVSMYFKTLPN